jgi:phage baseplate assembly protein V
MLRQIKDWVIQYVRSVLESTVRTAVVSSVDPSRGTVRVRIPDDDDLISYDLRVLSRKTHQDKDYWMPDVGEHVLCLFLPYGLEQGFVLGAFYSQEDQPPAASQDRRHVLFGDGTWLEYDRKTNTLSGHIKGQVDQLTVDNDAILDVGGSVQATIGQDLIANVGNNAEVTAGGSHVLLNAPLIKLQGNLSAAAQGGGTATETKEADTEHTGSYTLTGDLEVDGNIHATGDILADGSNVNHHTH